MPIVLLRVDERLIHGQVVIGWGRQLHPDRYVVVDDALATSRWEQDLYRLGSGGAEVLFVPLAEARARVPEWREARERTILLTRDVATMRGLAEGGKLAGETLIVGGVHHRPGRKEVLTYVHLSQAEVEDLEAIAAAGVEVAARDLPDAPMIRSDDLRHRWTSFK